MNAAFCIFTSAGLSEAPFWLCGSPAEPAKPKADLPLKSQHMFEAEVMCISDYLPSRDGGIYRRIDFWVLGPEGREARVYLNPEHRNHKKWPKRLRVGMVLEGLVWKDEADGLIHGDSPAREV